MIVSWNWLKDYVPLDVSHEELTERLMMAGLNHEGTAPQGDDLAIDLEVTSNRPDCLGHIGVAREAAVLLGRELKVPQPAPAEAAPSAAELTAVELQCPELCPRYTARVIRGVKVGPSPAWLVRRLETLGLAVINNVVDITNYVLMECGQPLHAFDLARLRGRRIVVRSARAGEQFLAIDHRTYDLTPQMCVIADAERAVALGGVMGGADSEVSPGTTDLLIESAEFGPLSIRGTARRLGLHSPSSYRFERGVDPEGVDWASRRCCELILELSGGELAAGSVDVGRQPTAPESVVLRFAQLERILGIPIDVAEVRRILTALGCREQSADAQRATFVPPSWRRDLTREIDLVEEAARIHGYDKIPEDVSVPMAPSTRSTEDRVLSRLRRVLSAAGIDEALTTSTVDETLSEVFSPWTDSPPLRTETPVLRRADRLRRSLVPSLLAARRGNEALANHPIELYEVATVYWSRPAGLPEERRMIGLASGGDYLAVKGVIEAMLAALNAGRTLQVADCDHPLLDRGHAAWLLIDNERLGLIGQVSAAGLRQFDLRGPATIAELQLSMLVRAARLVPQSAALSPYPAVSRDINLVVDEPVCWAAVREVVLASAGEALESVDYQDTYRDEARLGKGKKSLLFRITLRSPSGTLTSDEADAMRDQIVARLGQAVSGQLRA